MLAVQPHLLQIRMVVHLYLSGGVSTGLGTSSVDIKTSAAGSSGTSDNSVVSRITVAGDSISFNGNVSGEIFLLIFKLGLLIQLRLLIMEKLLL